MVVALARLARADGTSYSYLVLEFDDVDMVTSRGFQKSVLFTQFLAVDLQRRIDGAIAAPKEKKKAMVDKVLTATVMSTEQKLLLEFGSVWFGV